MRSLEEQQARKAAPATPTSGAKSPVVMAGDEDSIWSMPPSTPPPGFEGLTPPATPPPPGFEGGGTPLGVSPSGAAAGESLRTVGALSAPPGSDVNPGPEERNRLASELLWNPQQDEVVEARGPASSELNNRNTSFNNLATFIGKELTESMDADATREVKSDVGSDPTRQSRFPIKDHFDPNQDLSSFTRMARHAATRLIGTGTSPTRESAIGSTAFTAPAPASLFPNSVGSGNGASDKLRDAMEASSANNRDHGRSRLPAAATSTRNDDPLAGFREEFRPRATTAPLSLFPGNINRSRLPATKDLGVTVFEPTATHTHHQPHHQKSRFPQTRSEDYRTDNTTYEIEQGMRNAWITNNDRYKRPPLSQDITPPDNASVESSASGGNYAPSPHQAEAELRPFLWDVHHNQPSRALAILGASVLRISDVKSTCEAFGILEVLRTDFADRGIYFLAFYDIRSAQYAAMELRSCLRRLVKDQQNQDDISVYYCVPLNSSAQHDESVLIISDLPNLWDEDSLSTMLSCYGAVRSVRYEGGHYGGSAVVVEFHNTQDARQALLELESSQPWGPDVTVEVGTRSPIDRKRGRELLALIGRWRHGHSHGSRRRPDQQQRMPHSDVGPPHRESSSSSSPSLAAPPETETYRPQSRYDAHEGAGRPQQSTQLVLGPDGRYSYMVVNHSPYPPYGAAPPHHNEVRHHVVQGPQGAYLSQVPPAPAHQHQPPQHHIYWSPQHPQSSHHSYQPQTTVVSASPYGDSHHISHHHGGQSSVPYYAHSHPVSQGDSGYSVNHHPHLIGVPQPSNAHKLVGEDKDNRHLLLDLEAVETGRDTRTSLMVRNIPNKYTQQMLLSEFTENGHGPGKIDFFYLPIDFKNRCNRGYAFINFVDYRDILAFHQRYYGKHWRTFNSDKICDITYARIQGKTAMLKRFENSALMEKDDEYKPLVFASHGPEKGNRLPFPDPASRT